MILKGSQRGSAKALALHLLNDRDNDFVEVHQLHGFLSDDMTGAFKEIQAIAKGTRCRQPFFSVSLNPPAEASVSIEMFEAALERIEEANGLTGQPRVIVFHEKDGRRHAHAVWSRIDAQKMTAKNLPHFKNRLQAISRDLFFEHQWKMPPGLRDRSQSNPTNVTLAEWQAAKRRGKNAIDQKKLIQQCWASSDSRAGFEAALQDYGYRLAKGDRRGHVIVCHDGEVLAVARATGLRAKAVRARLGEPDGLLSVEEILARHARDLLRQFGRLAGEARQELTRQRATLDAERTTMIARHRAERAMIDKGQAARWAKESQTRAAHLKSGMVGIWQRLTGAYRKLQTRNAEEAYAALRRDRAQRQRLIDAQLKDRHGLELSRTQLRQTAFGLIASLRADQSAHLDRLLAPKQHRSPRRSARRAAKRDQNPELGLDL